MTALPSLNSDDWRRNLLFSPSIWHKLCRQRYLPLTPSSVRCTTLAPMRCLWGMSGICSLVHSAMHCTWSEWHLQHNTLSNALLMSRVGQNRIYTPYMAVYLVISVPKIPYIYGPGQPYLWGMSGICSTIRCGTLLIKWVAFADRHTL